MSSSSALPAWELNQLARLYQHRPDQVRAALQRLLDGDPELRWSVVVGAYLDRQINLGKAAEMLKIHELELRTRFLDLGIPLRQGSTDADEARAEAATARRWLLPPNDEDPAV